MEIVCGILSSVFTEIGKCLVEHSIHQANYLLRFKNIVDDLKKEEGNLRLRHDSVKEDVEQAKRNAEAIKKEVEKWLMDVQNVLEEIQRLKDEIELNKTFLCGRCPNWRWRYKLGRRAVKKTSEMSKLRESGNFSRVSHPTTPSGVEGPKDFISFKPMKDAFSQIMEALKNENMVGLYGMGGVGKTTLAKVVGKEAKEKKLFDEVVMVTVTQNPDFKKIQTRIAVLLGMKFEDEEETLRAQRLCLRLKTVEKILIILDDVWMELELEEIGIPFGDAHKGCTILLTTRRQEVCRSMRCQPRIHLNILSDDEALTLFKKHANICDSPELNAVAKKVVGECGGLPIAIKAIGSALREKNVDEWKVVSEKLKWSKFPDIETVDQNVYACLKLSYDYLKAEETRFCFLLCSLFPEDYEIDLEELLSYGLGLDLYGDANTIEKARRQLRDTINNLKSSCLLLDAEEGFVKMHDLVRDVALWITSKGENVFMVKAGMGLTEWPKHQGLEQCTAISLMENDIEVLPNGLVCPKLKILLLGGYYGVKVSDGFFEEMQTLKVASLRWVDLSVKSLQFLTNLVTLQLIRCSLRDISSIKKLAQLEILKLEGSRIVELPEELGELSKLRMLDITYCGKLKRIPANVIPRLSRLEELYIGNSFKAWEVEGTSAEGSNASLSELSKLYRLSILSLCIDVHQRLPKDFVLPMELLRYDIRVNDDDDAHDDDDDDDDDAHDDDDDDDDAHDDDDDDAPTKLLWYDIRVDDDDDAHDDDDDDDDAHDDDDDDAHDDAPTKLLRYDIRVDDDDDAHDDDDDDDDAHDDDDDDDGYYYKGASYPKSRLLKIKGIEATSLVAFKALYKNVEYLELMKIMGSCQNMVPSIDETGLNELKRLSLQRFAELECIIDTTHQKDVASTAFSNLVDLSLESVRLREICSGGRPPRGFLENLETLKIRYCHSMSCLCPSWMLIQSLRKLKQVIVWICDELEDVFQLEGLSYAKENPFLLSSLKGLHLGYLKNLRYIWKGPTQQVSLQSLTVVYVVFCKKLRYLFTLSLARSLLQLEQLQVLHCDSLEHIVERKEAEENVGGGGGNDVMFPKLRKLQLLRLENFINFFDSENYSSTWPALQELSLCLPLNSTTSFVAQLEAKMLQTSKEKLRVLNVGIKSDQLCNSVLAQLIHGFQNLEELHITDCRLSQLELSLPSLKVLELFFLEELECLCKGPTHLLSLPNLKKLKVSYCKRLRHMFSPSLARNLLQLEELIIEYCGELEQIFIEDDAAEYNQTLSKDHLQLGLFPNLSSISVNSCGKLKKLFSATLARNLLQLESIHIWNCEELEQIIVEDHTEDDHVQLGLFPNLSSISIDGCGKLKTLFSAVTIARSGLQKLKTLRVEKSFQLEELFGHKDEADMTSHKEMVLPQLEILILRELASLVNFCPVGYHFVFPSLSRLVVTKCPKLTTRFSVDQNRSVHTEAEAPQTSKEDVDMEVSPPKTTREIYCFNFDALQEQLPPYIGK